jgi:hypothetical protein
MAHDVVTATLTLLAVLLGSWLSMRVQERLWRRDEARQWRDIRLDALNNFLTAFRRYIAFILEPSASIIAAPHPRKPGDMMPFFDREGQPYKEQLEATKTTLRLIAQFDSTVQACNELVRQARLVAAERAATSATDLPSERFIELWAAERQFVLVARAELGLGRYPKPADNQGPK